MSNTPTSRGDDRISTVLVWWLLAVSGSVLIGFLLLAFAPAVSGATWGVGIVLNVSMPVAVGVFFGWTHQGLQVLIAVVLGAVVTILGLISWCSHQVPLRIPTSGCLPMPPSIASVFSLHSSGWRS
jgi:hypothetical protein